MTGDVSAGPKSLSEHYQVFNSLMNETMEPMEWNPGDSSFHNRAATTEKDLSPYMYNVQCRRPILKLWAPIHEICVTMLFWFWAKLKWHGPEQMQNIH